MKSPTTITADQHFIAYPTTAPKRNPTPRVAAFFKMDYKLSDIFLSFSLFLTVTFPMALDIV
jgi:hypothetical protein